MISNLRTLSLVNASLQYFQFVLKPEIPLTPEDPVVTLEPLVMSLRQERYAYIKDLHIWDMPLNHVELASLVSFHEEGGVCICNS